MEQKKDKVQGYLVSKQNLERLGVKPSEFLKALLNEGGQKNECDNE